jgi:predicted AAA+ superfamily ATPase
VRSSQLWRGARNKVNLADGRVVPQFERHSVLSGPLRTSNDHDNNVCDMAISPETVQVIRDLNPWWQVPAVVRPEPPAFQRPLVAELSARLRRPKGLIEVVRGPRQVGKTTGIYQIIRDLLTAGIKGSDILFLRFDLELLREEPAILRAAFRWFIDDVRKRPAGEGHPCFLFLDEIHKLRRWSEEIKHLGDTFPVRMLLTGSSSVLVARGGRESLAGRVFTTELPTFAFREILECWKPHLAEVLPPRIRFNDVFDGALRTYWNDFSGLKAQQKLSIRRQLDRYYSRGGYPRLYSGEVEDDRWADYLTETVFQNVLGADIPDLFPVRSPELLRFIYLYTARHTGQEISQNAVADEANAAKITAHQVTVGQYFHYLNDALLIREFRRYPIAKKRMARVPAKMTLSDLGVRNAIFRGAPSLWESDPSHIGPLVETLAQGVIRDHNLQTHFFRDYEDPKNRRSPIREVDFVAERIDGVVVPVEVKFRRRIDRPDLAGLTLFRSRYKPPLSVLVTRETGQWNEADRTLSIPLEAFLSAF